MRITVIGGTAFMGPHLLRFLAAQGHELTVFHRGKTQGPLPPDTREILGDRHRLPEHAAALRASQPDVVIDMVLLTEADSRALHATFRGVAQRVLAVSSVDASRAYGVLLGLEDGPPEPVPFDEDAPVRTRLFPFRGKVPGMDDYEKVLVEREILAHPDLPATVLRLPMVYGPGDRQHRLFEFLKRMDDKRHAILLDERVARWRGSRGYVENVAGAIALAATHPRAAGRVYNVADPEALSTRRWVESVGQAAGWDGEIVVLPPDRVPAHLKADMNTAQDLWADSTRIRRELGYRETVSFGEGLSRTVAWERANPPAKVPPEAFDYAAEDAALGAK